MAARSRHGAALLAATLATACCRSAPDRAGNGPDDTPGDPSMPTTTTTIRLPRAPDPGFDQRLGALAAAARAPDGTIRVAVALGAEAIATAPLRGGEVDAVEAAGVLDARSRGAVLRRTGDGLRVVGLDGAEAPLPAGLVRDDGGGAWWATAGGDALIATGGWSALHHVRAGATTWSVGTGAEEAPYVTGFAVAPDGTVHVATADPDGARGALVARAPDGTERWRRELPVRPGEVVVAPDGSELAVLTHAPARCEACVDARIFAAATGEPRRSLVIDHLAIPVAVDGHDGQAIFQTIGFTGDALWIHVWRRARRGDLGDRVDEACWYVVYDATVDGGRVRRKDTLACSVRAVIGLADGAVVTVEPVAAGMLRVRAYAGPP